MGTVKGNLLFYHVQSGQLISEFENAHYLGITDIDLSPGSQQDLLATSGKDGKVKIWITCNLLSNQSNSIDQALICEFGDAASEVT